MPRIADLAIVGGGMSGLAVAGELLSRIELKGERESPFLAEIPSHVRLLCGGKSWAYSPVEGQFGDYLTVSGTDKYRRDDALQYHRDKTERGFRKLGYSFEKGVHARGIRDTDDNTFEVTAQSTSGTETFRVKKIVLALGHTLKEVPVALQPYVILGGGDLCQRLSNELTAGVSREECIERLLSHYKRMPDGVVRIALVGLGATTIEVMRVFESLLSPPTQESDKYLTKSSRTPVEFVVYAPNISGSKSHVAALFEEMNRSFGPDGTPEKPLHPEFISYKLESVARFRRIHEAGQLTVLPRRFEWNDLCVHEDVVIEGVRQSISQPFSCIVDCSPYVEGFGTEQRHLLMGLEDLHMWKVSEGAWRAVRDDEVHKGRLALVGSAFTAKSKWLVPTFQQQAREIIDEFFPRL